MRIKLIVFLLFTICVSHAQNKHYENEYKSGYRGDYLKNITVPKDSWNFMVIGDWGRCGEYYQKEVANQLAAASISTNAEFVVSTGDNFYPKGVISVDDPLWKKSYEDVYHHFSLQKDWYIVLGNHDYKVTPQAQIDYTQKSRRWKLPSHYYSLKFPIDGDTMQQIQILFMDTTPLIDKYYSEPEYSPFIITQDTAAQMNWLRTTLADKDPSIKWRIVIGHHPLYTSGKRINSIETLQFRKRMNSLFEKYKVDAYICGHEHQLEYIKPDGCTHHFISGAGSEARDVKGNLAESKFKIADHGFISFSITNEMMKAYFINWEGKILSEQTIEHSTVTGSN